MRRFFDDGVSKAIDYFCEKLNDDGLIRYILSYFVKNKELVRLSWIKRRKLYSKFMIKLDGLSVAGLLNEFKGYNFDRFLKVPNVAICELISQKCPDLAQTAKKCKIAGRTPEINKISGLERLERLQRLQQLEQLQQLTISNLSYADFNFKELGLNADEIIIYCAPLI